MTLDVCKKDFETLSRKIEVEQEHDGTQNKSVPHVHTCMTRTWRQKATCSVLYTQLHELYASCHFVCDIH